VFGPCEVSGRYTSCTVSLSEDTKPRAEQIQAAALAAGIYKALKDGTKQRERDRKMKERMDPSNPRHESWKAGSALDWLYAYDVVDSVSCPKQYMIQLC